MNDLLKTRTEDDDDNSEPLMTLLSIQSWVQTCLS